MNEFNQVSVSDTRLETNEENNSLSVIKNDDMSSNTIEITLSQSYRLFNKQQFFLSDYNMSIQSMQSPAIAIIGCRRVSMLRGVVESLFKMTTIDSYSVYISLGCPESLSEKDESMKELRYDYPSLHFLQYTDPPGASIPPSFLRIQNHYVFVLKELFEKREHSEVILLEDDLALSPSLLNYYEQTFQLLYADPSLLCISAFNDNAYTSLLITNRMAETFNVERLRRSAHFPNLALLFHREGYNRVWKNQKLDSTTNGWDHWLRIRIDSLGGECVFPVVPRVRHLRSDNSTTASSALSNRLEKYPLVEESSVDLGNVSYLLLSNYDQSLLSTVLESSYVSPVLENMQLSLSSFLGSGRDLSSLYDNELRWKEDLLVFVQGKDDIKKVKMYSDRVIVVFILREVGNRVFFEY